MELVIHIKMDLALNNLQRLICHKTHQTKPNHLSFSTSFLSIYLSNSISVFLSFFFSLYTSVYFLISIYLSISVFFVSFLFLSFSVFFFLSIYESYSIFVFLSLILYVCLYLSLFSHFYLRLSFFLSFFLFSHFSISLFILTFGGRILSQQPDMIYSSWVDSGQSVTRNSSDQWGVTDSIVFFDKVPLKLTTSMFFTTIYPSVNAVVWSKKVRRSLDEVTEVMKRSMVSGYIKMEKIVFRNVTTFFLYIVCCVTRF